LNKVNLIKVVNKDKELNIYQKIHIILRIIIYHNVVMLEKTFHSLNKKIIKIIKIEEEHYVQCIKQTNI